MKKLIPTLLVACCMIFGAAFCFSACDKGSDEHAHVWDGGEITTPATCTAEGVKTFKCTVEGCNESYTEAVGKIAHDFTGAWVKVDNDKHAKKCVNCEAVDTATAEHNFVEDTEKRVEATCHSNGQKTYECSDCHATKTEDITNRPNHDFTGDIVSVSEDGHANKCVNCEAVDSENYTAHTCSDEYDENGHWQSCSECDYETEPEQHDATETVISPAAFNQKGEVKYSCECGYETTEETSYAEADFGVQFTTAPEADHPWVYGTANYTWDPAESFTFTAATETNDGGDGWKSGGNEIKAGWINSNGNVAIGYKISEGVTKISYDLSYKGGGDDPGRFIIRIWRMAEDGTLVGNNVFINQNPDGGEVAVNGEIDTAEGETVYLIFFHEGGWEQVADFKYVLKNVTPDNEEQPPEA